MITSLLALILIGQTPAPEYPCWKDGRTVPPPGEPQIIVRTSEDDPAIRCIYEQMWRCHGTSGWEKEEIFRDCLYKP